MHDHNHDHNHVHHHDPAPSSASTTPLTEPQARTYRRVLWLALALNAVMCVVEVLAGRRADSSALLADSADFLADAINYGVSLWALSQAARTRANVAWVKGVFMVGYGAAVLGQALWALWHGSSPQAFTMAWVSMLAFATNMLVAWLFYAFRSGEANMRAVWLDARNDVLGNLAVLGAALAVWATRVAWADLAVAFLMAALAVKTGLTIMRHARLELRRFE